MRPLRWQPYDPLLGGSKAHSKWPQVSHRYTRKASSSVGGGLSKSHKRTGPPQREHCSGASGAGPSPFPSSRSISCPLGGKQRAVPDSKVEPLYLKKTFSPCRGRPMSAHVCVSPIDIGRRNPGLRPRALSKFETETGGRLYQCEEGLTLTPARRAQPRSTRATRAPCGRGSRHRICESWR